MGILSKLSPEKHPYFSKPKTHQTNLSENSSCSLTGSEFLLTGSHSSNSSNETTGISMNKVNGAPRRVKNLPIALTPNIGGEKYNFPTGANNQGSSPKENTRRPIERKPPPPPEKELKQSSKVQRHPYSAQMQNLSQDAYSKVPPDQTNTTHFKPKNEQYSHYPANSQRVNQTPPHDLPNVNHQRQGQYQQIEKQSPLSKEKTYSDSRKPHITEEPYYKYQRAMNNVPKQYVTTNRSFNHDSVNQTTQKMQKTPSQPQYYHEQRPAVEESEDDSEEYSEEDSDSDSEKYTDTSEESVNNSNENASNLNQYANVPQQHPYYEQWMQYYASLAAQQQQQQQQQQQSASQSPQPMGNIPSSLPQSSQFNQHQNVGGKTVPGGMSSQQQQMINQQMLQRMTNNVNQQGKKKMYKKK